MGLTRLPRLVWNSWTQAILLPWSPELLGLQAGPLCLASLCVFGPFFGFLPPFSLHVFLFVFETGLPSLESSGMIIAHCRPDLPRLKRSLNLSLPSSWDYSCLPPCLAHFVFGREGNLTMFTRMVSIS